MPAFNKSKSQILAYQLVEARKPLSRMVGLLGKESFDAGHALWIRRCNSIHTVGMGYPVDVVFLDDRNRVVKSVENLRPYRIVPVVKGAVSVLELPAGACRKSELQTGDCIDLSADVEHAVGQTLRRSALHLLANFCLAIFYFRFVRLSYLKWVETGSLVPFGLMFVNTLLVYLFLTRRHSKQVTRRAIDWFAALGTVFLPLCLVPMPAAHGLLLGASVGLQVLGIGGMLASLASLGRSFGVVAALRPIKSGGMYHFVRHPLYASEIIFFFGFVVGNLAFLNVALLLGIFVGQYIRAVAEERLLSTKASYRSYLKRVQHRFVPGLF